MARIRGWSTGRAVCPYCSRANTALTKFGRLAQHGQGRPCPAGGLTLHEAREKLAFDARTRSPRRPSRPTCRPMLGGETGNDRCSWLLGHAPLMAMEWGEFCTADDARPA